jgi:hypothetical protein
MPTCRPVALVPFGVPRRQAQTRCCPRHALLGVVLLGALLASCGDSQRPAVAPVNPASSAIAATSAPATPDAKPDAGAPAEALPAGVPDTPAGRQLAWVLGALAHAPSEGDAEPHFTPRFFAKVPAAKVAELFAEVDAKLAPFALDRVEPEAHPGRLAAVVRSAKGARLRVTLAVEDGESHRMELLLVTPVIESKLASSWDDVQAIVRAAAPSVTFLAAEIKIGRAHV